MIGVHPDARLIIRDRACIVFIIRDVSREHSRRVLVPALSHILLSFFYNSRFSLKFLILV